MQQGNIKKALDNLDNAGYRLRCAREYMGLSEKEVADELKLMVSHVRAIEQNRSEYLVQRKPFERYLRAYARMVQLNPDTIVDMYFAKSEPAPAQPVDITTRLEIPSQPVAMPPVGGRRSLASNNYYHPAILGTGFLVIGLSLFAGWGVKQLVGSSQIQPQLAQNDLLEVRASTRRQSATAAVPELTAIQFEKPVTSVPAADSANATQALQPIEVAVEQRAVAQESIADLPTSASPVASEPVQVASQKVEAKVELQQLSVSVKQRPIVKPKPVVAKEVSHEPSLAAVADASPKPPATAVAKTRALKKAEQAVAAVIPAEKKPLAVGETTVAASKVAATVPIVKTPLLQPVTVSINRKPTRRIGTTEANPLANNNTSGSNAVTETVDKSRPAPAAAITVAASQTATASLQPIKVTAQQRLAPQPAKLQEVPEADDLQQIVEARSAPLPASVTQHTSAELDLGPDLDEEASDLNAVINASAVEKEAQPFETALANSSDSASVARLALLESYKSTLRRRVYENVTYPGRAQRRNQEGKVVMSATVSRGGELLSVEMAEASKYSSLNRASEKAIKKASPFPAAPDTLTGDSFVLTVPVVFRVPER